MVTKTATYLLRLTPADLKRLHAAAKRKKLSLANYIRGMLGCDARGATTKKKATR